MRPYVHYSIIQGGQDMETIKVSFQLSLDKEDVAHKHSRTLLSHKKKMKCCHL